MDESAFRFKKNADHGKDFCDSNKMTLEDDEDSGIEIGPTFSLDQGDNVIFPGELFDQFYNSERNDNLCMNELQSRLTRLKCSITSITLYVFF